MTMDAEFDAPDFAPNPRAVIAGNQPPSAIDLAREAYKAVAEWMKGAPVIQDEATAKDAKLYLDRGNAALADLEREKALESKPLYDNWKACLAKFAPATGSLETLLLDLKKRMTAYVIAEEKKRQAVLAEARRVAEEARLAALEAERIERETKDDASQGDCGADVGAAIAAADAKFGEFKQADHAALLAARESKVTLSGGFARGVGLKNKTTLVLDDWQKAISCLGLTDDISAAILKSARAYKSLHKKLPDGVSETVERSI